MRLGSAAQCSARPALLQTAESGPTPFCSALPGGAPRADPGADPGAGFGAGFVALTPSPPPPPAGRDPLSALAQRPTSKKRRKSRTAFSNQQLFELERRFVRQKYLSPADRDQLAQRLALSSAQVITWFQNRRAKLKRDLEEMKADVESAKKLGPNPAVDIVALAELEPSAEGRGKARPGSPPPPPATREPGAPPPPRPASPPTERPRSRRDSEEEEDEEEEDVEIDVDD